MKTIEIAKYTRPVDKDYCRSLVDPSKRDELQTLVRRIGDLLDAEGGEPVALIIGGYCNGVHLVKGDEAASHVIFFYKDEVILLEETSEASVA